MPQRILLCTTPTVAICAKHPAKLGATTRPYSPARNPPFKAYERRILVILPAVPVSTGPPGAPSGGHESQSDLFVRISLFGFHSWLWFGLHSVQALSIAVQNNCENISALSWNGHLTSSYQSSKQLVGADYCFSRISEWSISKRLWARTALFVFYDCFEKFPILLSSLRKPRVTVFTLIPVKALGRCTPCRFGFLMHSRR